MGEKIFKASVSGNNVKLSWGMKIKKTMAVLALVLLLGGLFSGRAFANNDAFGLEIKNILKIVKTLYGINYIPFMTEHTWVDKLFDAFDQLDPAEHIPEGLTEEQFDFVCRMKRTLRHYNTPALRIIKAIQILSGLSAPPGQVMNQMMSAKRQGSYSRYYPQLPGLFDKLISTMAEIIEELTKMQATLQNIEAWTDLDDLNYRLFNDVAGGVLRRIGTATACRTIFRGDAHLQNILIITDFGEGYDILLKKLKLKGYATSCHDISICLNVQPDFANHLTF